MCKFHNNLVNKLLFGTNSDKEDTAAQLRHFRHQCNMGQNCQDERIGHSDPTPTLALKGM